METTPDGVTPGADPAPPPSPFERTDEPVLDRPAAPRRGRGRERGQGRARAVVVALVLLAAGGGFVAGLAASDVLEVPDVLRSSDAVESERATLLVELLRDITGTEGVMLAFDESVGEALDAVPDQETALGRISDAAAAGADALAARRPAIVDRRAGGPVDDVRTAYLPHLDSWIEYLSAVAERPELLFSRSDQQPYILRINATAEVFREALKDLLASQPAPEAAELAERILDDGFRSEGPPPSL